jgi:DNA-binding SARP family transcriptional activator
VRVNDRFQLFLFGGFRLVHNGAPIPALNAPRLQSLIAYLALHRHMPVARQTLAFALWQNSTDAQARTNLRFLLHQLRRAFPPTEKLIAIEHATLQWRAAALDVAEFEHAGAQNDRAALERAVALYAGDVLPECYDDWIAPERERLREMFWRALDALTRTLEEARDYAGARQTAQRLLQLDPLREQTYRTLMRLAALQGDRASALRFYHTCATLLERELSVEPSPATREQYEQLLNLATPAPSAPARATALVGRKSEWRVLQSAWHRARANASRLILIAGEPGIGKTRLAEEFLQWARHHAIATATARCYATERAIAYAPMRGWLEARALDALDAATRTEIARLVPALQNDSAPSPLTESWQVQHFHDALARTLASTQPQIFFIDDLQWCDAATFQWLDYFLRCDARARVLMIGAVRLEEIAPAHPLNVWRFDLQRRGICDELALAPLDARATAALSAQIAQRDLVPALAARIYRETEGNPLFIVEMAQIALDAPVPLPQAQAVIAARLAQLSPAAHALLEVAALIGREFTYDVLARASELEDDALVRALDELWHKRLVREQGAHAYDFSHDKIREVAAGALSRANQRRLHRRIAAALVALATRAEDARELASRILAHARAGDDFARVVAWTPRAAERAERLDDLRGALALYEAGSDAVTQGETPERARHQIEFLLARARLVGRLARGAAEERALLDQAAALIAHNPDARLEAESALREANYFNGVAQYARAYDAAMRALTRGDAADALYEAGRAKLNLGQNQAAQKILRDALAVCVARNDAIKESAVLSQLAIAHLNLGEIEVVFPYLIRARAIAQAQDNQFGLAQVDCVLALAWNYYYDAAQMETRAREALQIYRAFDVPLLIARAHIYLATAEFIRGRDAAARTMYQQIFRATEQRDAWLAGWSAQMLGRLALRRRDSNDAATWLARASAMRDADAEAFNHISDLAWMSRVHRARGDAARALDCTTHALALYERLPAQFFPWEFFDVLFAHSQALADNRQRAPARAALKRARDCLREFAAQIADARVKQNFLAYPPNARILR